VSTTDEVSAAALEEAWGLLPQETGRGTTAMLTGAVEGAIKAIILVGADPVRDCPDPSLADAGLEAAEFVVAFDSFVTDSSKHADIMLPAAMWSEVDGSVTNLEGRVQTVSAALGPRGQARSVSDALNDVATAMGSDLTTFDVSAVSKEIATVAPCYEGVTRDSLTFTSDGTGVVVPIGDARQPLGYIPTDKAVPVVTDRFTLHLAGSLYDDGVTTRNSPSIAGLVPDVVARLNPRDASVLAIQDGTAVVIGGVFELPARLDTTVAQGSVVLPFNQSATKGLRAVSAVSVEAKRGDE
jgi:predicted molibdopterin-dependent oxidoreductase YjgC